MFFFSTVYGIVYQRSAISFQHFLTVETWASFVSSASRVAWGTGTLAFSALSLDAAASWPFVEVPRDYNQSQFMDVNR
jgi:hypothetical protein